MPIDINREKLVPLDELLAELPNPPSRATAWRWRTAGVKGHRLEVAIVGGRVNSSREALQRFVNALSGAAAGEVPAPLPEHRETADKKRRLDAADRRAAELLSGGKSGRPAKKAPTVV